MQHITKAGILVLLCYFLASCSSSSSRYSMQNDAPPDKHVDVNHIPDAVPVNEPLSRGGNKDYIVYGKRYSVMKSSRGYKQRGVASWYGKKFHGHKTSNGEVYDMFKMTAAHKSLPLPSFVRVTNLTNGRSVIVRVNDRGPFHQDRLIDLSYAAAKKLKVIPHGTAVVEIEAIDTRKPARPAKPAGKSLYTRQKELNSFQIFLQAGAYLEKNNAMNMHAKLTGIAISQPTSVTYYPDDKIYRVRVGPISTVEVADLIAARIARSGIAAPHIVID